MDYYQEHEYTPQLLNLEKDSDDNKVINEINNALVYFEQLQDCVERLETIDKNLKVNEYTEDIKVVIEKMKTLIAALDTNEGGESVKHMFKEGNLKRLPKTKIERLGYGRIIIDSLNRGENIKDISNKLSLSVSMVSKFCKMYENLKPSEKYQVKRRSVFNIADNYEELYVLLYRTLSKLENLDPEVYVKCASEVRLLLAAVDKFVEKNTERKKIQELGQVILEILIAESPERRAHIIERFRKIGIGHMIGA